MRTPLLLCVPCAVATIAACTRPDRDSADWNGTMDTVAGRIIVDNPDRPIWRDGEGWQLVEEVRIGSAEGTGPAVFGNVAAIAVDPRGRILVLDNRAREVRVFAPDGSHIRTIGRSGPGPGEFAFPIGMAAAPDGSILVVDPRNRRYTVVDSTGALRATHPRPVAWMRIPWPGGVDTGGAIVDVSRLGGGVSDSPNEVLVRLSHTFAIRDTIALPAPPPREMMNLRDADGLLVMSVADPWTPQLVWRFDPRGFVWAAHTARYEILQLTPRGDTLRMFRRAASRIPVSRVEHDSSVAMIEQLLSSEAPGGKVDRQPRIPEAKPALQRFYVASDGVLWVEPSRPHGEPQRFDVFDSVGRFMGTVRPPQPIASDPLPVFTRDAVYGVVRDSLDVPHVVRLGIRR